jgi:pyruvate formate lyase activating enzyme
MLDHPPTPVETSHRARDIGLAAGLHHVYLGNAPGDPGENTWCPSCQAPLIERIGFRVRANRMEGGCCPDCGSGIDGVEMSASKPG